MSTAVAPMLRAGALYRPLASLCLRPRAASLLAKSSRLQHAGSLATTSVTVRAVAAAERQQAAPPASFGQLGVSVDLLASLAEKGINEPTEIQAEAVPALLRDRASDYMIASHTGSGKTLAYLLPIVQLLKEAEELQGAAARPKRPRALVLGPTRELTDQILRVAKALAHTAKFRSALVNGGSDMGGQRQALERPLDVLVGTPQRVMQHAEKSHLYYGDVEVVVLDEADTMFDRGFGPEVKAILAAVRSKRSPARCILVSATMTKAVLRLVEEEFPGMKKAETSSLHRGVAGARHLFVPLPPVANKLDLLLQVVEGEHRRGKHVMIFCNTLASCRAADHYLRERGMQTACYHGDVPVDERRAAIQSFADSGNGAARPPLLVCTDLAARGLDIPGQVDHVINFDFPLNSIDYLHRTGRTARAGATGKISSLVTKGDRVLADRIEEALQRGLPLDALSATKEVLPPHLRPKIETLRRKALQRKAEKHGNKGVRGAKRLEGGKSSSGFKSSSGSSSSSDFKSGSGNSSGSFKRGSGSSSGGFKSGSGSSSTGFKSGSGGSRSSGFRSGSKSGSSDFKSGSGSSSTGFKSGSGSSSTGFKSGSGSSSTGFKSGSGSSSTGFKSGSGSSSSSRGGSFAAKGGAVPAGGRRAGSAMPRQRQMKFK